MLASQLDYQREYFEAKVVTAQEQARLRRADLEGDLGAWQAKAGALDAELRAGEKTYKGLEKKAAAARQRNEALEAELNFLRDLNAQMIRDRQDTSASAVAVNEPEDAYVERLQNEVAALMAQLD